MLPKICKFPLTTGPTSLCVHNSTHSWDRYYSVLSFLLNGHLFSEYEKLSGMLGLPSCSHTTWEKIVEDLELHVTRLAEWSCNNVREILKNGLRPSMASTLLGDITQTTLQPPSTILSLARLPGSPIGQRGDDNPSSFEVHDIHFSDSLPLLRKV